MTEITHENARTYIPKAKVLDEKGETIYEGWYFEMTERQGYPIGDCSSEKIPTLQGVVICEPGDWGLANTARMIRVTPPHRIVLDVAELPSIQGENR